MAINALSGSSLMTFPAIRQQLGVFLGKGFVSLNLFIFKWLDCGRYIEKLVLLHLFQVEIQTDAFGVPSQGILQKITVFLVSLYGLNWAIPYLPHRVP